MSEQLDLEAVRRRVEAARRAQSELSCGVRSKADEHRFYEMVAALDHTAALLAEVETLAGLVVDIVDLTPADERHRLPVPLRAYADRWREYVKSRPEWTANFGAEEWTEDDV